MTYGFTNYAPVLWGLPTVSTNFTMPETNATFVWIVNVPEGSSISSNGSASSRLDTVAFFPSQSPFLSLSIPQASNWAVRVVITATPLAGGRRVSLFDGMATPSFPFVQIPSETLRRSMANGTWILECQFPQAGLEKTKILVVRRMLFYAQ